MAYSETTYTASAGQTEFLLNFSILSSSEVGLEVDGVSKTDFTISSDRTKLTVGSSIVFNGGETVRIFRTTPAGDSQRYVDWSNGSVITEADLDTSDFQLLHISQEVKDNLNRALVYDPFSGTYNAGSRRIVSLGAPVNSGDAARLLDVQNAQISNGNLPSVTTGDNDNMLQVVNGAWAVSLPSTIWSSVFTPPEMVVATYADQTLVNTTSSTWYQSSTYDLVLNGFDSSLNKTSRISNSGNTITLAAGDWKITAVFSVTSFELGSAAPVVWAVVDQNGIATHIYPYNTSTLSKNFLPTTGSGGSNPHLTQTFTKLFSLSASTTFNFRAAVFDSVSRDIRTSLVQLIIEEVLRS